ncbi:MAG: permease-like cell division protein FtsX [Lachnospiraceae bacterium]|nr:permease-like cell division protein FtsX [Lachnospiraceae bacterium]
MRFSSLKYLLKEGVSGLFMNRLMTIASIAVVSACILIMSFSYCVITNINYVLKQLEESIGIEVFLDSNYTAEEINKINDEISKIEHITQVVYVSPSEALAQLKDEWDADDVLEGFNEENNPLSHSFEIKIDNIKNQSKVLDALNQIKDIKNITHAQGEAEVLLKVNKLITIAGGLTILILAIISVVIIFNTIKISVYTRKTEINIMKYVGATDWFIRWPFLIEGIFIGFIGSVIPMLISWPLYGKTISVLYEYLPILKNIVTFRFGSDIFSVLIPVSFAAGILLGVVGSASSIRKHLNA